MQKKNLVVAATAAVVLVGAHYGGAALIGPHVEDRFRAEVQRLDALDQRVSVELADYQPGRLASTAEVVVRPATTALPKGAARKEGDEPADPPALRFDVDLQHGPFLARMPMPLGAVGFDATAHPNESLRDLLAAEFQPAPDAESPVMTLSGRGGFTGTIAGTFRSPAFQATSTQEDLAADWGGVQGDFSGDRSELHLTADIPEAELREDDSSRITFDEIRLEARGESTDGPYLLGEQSFAAASVDVRAPDGTLSIQQLDLASHLDRAEDGLEIGLEGGTEELHLEGTQLDEPVDWRDARLKSTLAGLDADAYGEIMAVLQTHPGEIPEPVLRQRVLPAVQTLLAGDPRLTLDRAAATNGNGTVEATGEAVFVDGARPDINRPRTVVEALDARLTVDAPSASVRANLRRSLISQGTPAEIAQRQAGMLVDALAADGYLEEGEDGRYRTEMTFQRSQLLVNGKPALGLMGALMQ
ncbi:MAG: DUF945 family protein [Pseudomonadota bacterium]